ncbi:hypothetical protein PghCCS26_37410 [Paenibacillus glycanilyticus]|uniref:Uncharacterized protein n=1 Tax=Paenibacillus glycanilyticus TaxID=126569 RepID=A0ABQ6NQV5_9BACL|nr:hypothetical protein PghCCS26_37410 [Paenibacillus glycanilyticus]
MKCNRDNIELYDLGVVDIKTPAGNTARTYYMEGHYAISCEIIIKQIYRSSQMPLNATLEKEIRTLHSCVNMTRRWKENFKPF